MPSDKDHKYAASVQGERIVNRQATHTIVPDVIVLEYPIVHKMPNKEIDQIFINDVFHNAEGDELSDLSDLVPS